MTWVELWRVVNCLLVAIQIPLLLSVFRRRRLNSVQRGYLTAFLMMALATLVGTLFALSKGVIFNPSIPIITAGLLFGLRAGYRSLHPRRPQREGKPGDSTQKT